MKKSQLQQIIKEEVDKTINKGRLEDKVADLYSWAGIKTQYSEDSVKRYGQKTVDMAIQMAPSVLAFKKELADTLKSMMESPEGKILIATRLAGRGYSGNPSKDISIYDLIR